MLVPTRATAPRSPSMPFFDRKTALVALGAAAAAPAALHAQTLEPLRIALVAVENAAQAYYARELGYFAKAGFDVELQPINNGGAIASAVVSGAADIGF